MDDWSYGETKDLSTSKYYNLKVTITKKQNKQFKKFKSFVDLYILNFEKLDSKEHKMGLKFENIELLEQVVKSFYERVMQYYRKVDTGTLKFQIDLRLGNLQYSLFLL